MNEIVFVFIQLLIFILIFTISPLSIINYRNKINLSIFENITFNILISINLILVISFFNLDINEMLKIYIIYLIIIFILNLKNLKTYLNFLNLKIFFFIILCLVIFFDIAYNLYLHWDAEKFWFNKVLSFYYNYPIDNLKNVGNSWYPHLGSLLWAFYWKISFIEFNYSGRLFYAFFYLSSIFLLIDGLKINLTLKAIITILLIFLTYDYYLVLSGNQEILIFSLIALSMYCFHNLINKNSHKIYQILTLILICNAMMWVKQEGVVFSLIIISTLILFFNFDKKIKLAIILTYVSLFVIRILIYNLYELDLAIHKCCLHNFSLDAIINKISIERILVIIKYFFLAFFKNYLLAFGAILVAVSFFNINFVKKYLFIYFFAFMSFSFVFIAYLMTDADLIFMLKTGMDRLMYQFSPFIVLLFVEYLNTYNKSKKKII